MLFSVLFMVLVALVLKLCALAVEQEIHSLRKEKQSEMTQVPRLCTEPLHIACGTDLLFTFFF